MQQTLVDDDSTLIGNRGGSHNSRCVNASMSTDALDAAKEMPAPPRGMIVECVN